jgi:hypothetical protein
MPTQDEELKLIVSLVDNASPGLGKIRRKRTHKRQLPRVKRKLPRLVGIDGL